MNISKIKAGECKELRGADLSGADLRGAQLMGADLMGADLGRCMLCDCDLRGATISFRDRTIIVRFEEIAGDGRGKLTA